MARTYATLDFIISQLKRSNSKGRRESCRARRLGFETLENRELLAVSLAEYAAIRDAYPALELPEDAGQINIVEIPADRISISGLNAALEEAGSTRADDLIVARVTASANVARFAASNDELKYELDADFFGKTTLVALGDAPLTIDANGLARCLSVAVGELAIANVSFQNGKATESGGAIFNAGALALDSCLVAASEAPNGAAVYSTGRLTASDSNFSGAKGANGVYVSGEATLTNCKIVSCDGDGLAIGSGGAATVVDCQFSENAGRGASVYLGELNAQRSVFAANGQGGLANSGATTLADCRLVDNSGSGLLNASVTVGASYASTLVADRVLVSGNASDVGAGLRNIGGQVELSNCEFSNNQATTFGGGLANESTPDFVDRVTLTNCTIAGNAAGEAGGGICGDSNFGLAIYNTIVAQNMTFGVDSNLSGDATVKNSVVGGNVEFVEPPIFDVATGRLQNAGAYDLRLTSGSAAVNVGDSARVPDGALDLKGEKRLYGRVDAGAYEYRNSGETTPERSLVVTTLADVVDPSDGATSLREAISWGTSKNKSITFADGLEGTIQLSGQLISTTALEIDGGGRITLSGQGNGRVLLNESSLVLKGLTLTGGSTSGDGGLVRSVGTLEIVDSELQGGEADGRGGQIFSLASLTIADSTLSSGGGSSAVYSQGDATIAHTEIVGAQGDGFYEYAGFASFVDSSVKGSGGSGIVDLLGSVELTNVVLESNGGAGLANMGSATITRSTIEGNGASGVLNESVPLADGSYFTASTTASFTQFVGNVGTNGGAVENRFGRFTASNAVFVGNRATVDGGAIYNEARDGSPNAAAITNCTIAGNVADRAGGGIASASSDSLLFVLNSIIAQNYAGDVDSNINGAASTSDGSLVGGNPQFVVSPIFDYASGSLANLAEIDLRLTETSPAIDLGDSVYNVSTTDFAGSARVSGVEIDAGAYEFSGAKKAPSGDQIVVTTLADSFDPQDGETSLREALFAAPPNARVVFAAGLAGTIRLNSQLVATSAVVVDGDGRIVVDAQSGSRAFLIEAPTELIGLRLVDGSSASDGGLIYASAGLSLKSTALVGARCGENGTGGAIYAADALALVDVEVEGATSSAAIRARGELRVSRSAIRNNASDGIQCEGLTLLDRALVVDNSGIGVRNLYGTITATNSTFSNNGKTGLDNLGEATLTNCVVSNNALSGMINRTDELGYSSVLKFDGGTISGNATPTRGGGVLNEGGALDLSNAEISGNAASEVGGGVYNERRANSRNVATLTNCTIAGNTATTAGGLGVGSAEFATLLYNTIIARNYAASGAANLQGAPTESVCSLASGAPGFRVDPLFDASGTLLNRTEYDLRLTRASVCVNAGDSSYATSEYDAAGSPRLISTSVDIGAYEYCQAPSTVVTTLDDTFELTDDLVSLREALYFAGDGDVVTFGALEGVVALASSLETAREVTIDGLGLIGLDGENASESLVVNSGTLKLVGLTFANGRTADEGGAIRNEGTLTIEDCVFDGCGGRLGGAIYNESEATLSCAGVLFTGNAAEFAGGALYNAGAATLFNATFRGNVSEGAGGAIYGSGETQVVNSLFSGNKAGAQGGAIYLSEGTFVGVNVTIARNAAASGGGLYGLGGTARLVNAIVATNTATSGGTTGADVGKVDATITASQVVSSQAFASSGIIRYDGSSALFIDPYLGDYRLAPGSLAIDAGSSAQGIESGLSAFATDLGGTRRYLGKSIDVGAYEAVPSGAGSLTVGLGEAFELSTGLEGAKTFWDLSGTGAGAYEETPESFYATGAELGLTPGAYLLRGRTETSTGEVVGEREINLQIVDAVPSVKATKMNLSGNAVVYSIEINELGAVGSRRWRIDWGDGASSYYVGSGFNAGKVYAPTDRARVYDVDLVLIDEFGLDACRFRLDGIAVAATTAVDEPALESALIDATSTRETFESPEEVAPALIDAAFLDYADEPVEQFDLPYVPTNQESFQFEIVGVERKALKNRKR